jgi:hypothetical protein
MTSRSNLIFFLVAMLVLGVAAIVLYQVQKNIMTPDPNDPTTAAILTLIPSPSRAPTKTAEISITNGNLPTTTSNPAPSETSLPMIWLDPRLPGAIWQAFSLPDGLVKTEQKDQATLRLEFSDQNPVSHWIFALVAPFPTIQDGITSQELLQAWQGSPPDEFSNSPLLMDETTLHIISQEWGAPAQSAVKILPANGLLDTAWVDRPAWAIVPFEALEPRWKVLEIDGASPIRNDFVEQNYILNIPISLNGTSPGSKLWNIIQVNLPLTNRDPGKLTTVVITGVTALVRGTALTMEQRGITYPAVDIAPWLQSADILHISNEIPFYDFCPYPVMYPSELVFCSSPRYMELLRDIGTDVVELTGDHFGDYGADATLQTLELYDQEGWSYYGGGKNATEAKQPLLLEHNGNHIAFMGCNAKGIAYYAPADEDTPGAVACDFDYIREEIPRLRQEGYLVIFTFQDDEYYMYEPHPKLVEDFAIPAAAGANIVSGSQAHQPHGMTFSGSTFIHYGLGNLFFDQYRFYTGPDTDRAFIDRHVFYDGKYISTELLTTYFVDLARSRPMTPQERSDFLQEIFNASGW